MSKSNAHIRGAELRGLLKSSQGLVSEVGGYIRAQRLRFKPSDLEQKSDNSLVSFVDKEAEQRLIEGLSKLLPESRFLSEETRSSTRLDQPGWLWVVDPLDGTTNFIHQLPAYCVSVALLENGRSILGIIYDVPHQNCYWALRGEGSFLNKEQIFVSRTSSIENSLLGVGFFAEDSVSAHLYVEALSKLSMRTRGWRRLGSAALQMAFVAAGYLDAYIDVGLKAWDVAAGLLLIEEAGGRLSSFSGSPIDINSVELLVAGEAHASFLKFMQSIVEQND